MLQVDERWNRNLTRNTLHSLCVLTYKMCLAVCMNYGVIPEGQWDGIVCVYSRHFYVPSYPRLMLAGVNIHETV